MTERGKTHRVDWGYWFFVGHLITLWGIALSNLLLALTGLWTWTQRRRFRGAWPRSAVLLAPLGLYAIFTVVSVVFSLEPGSSAPGLRELLNLSTLVLAVLWIHTAERARTAMTLFIGMAVAVAMLGIGQLLSMARVGLEHRITGGFSHYQTYSGILLLAILSVVARLLTRSGERWLWPSLLCLGTALALTLTRGAWVSLVATLLLLPLLLGHCRARVYVLGFIAMVGVIVGLGHPRPSKTSSVFTRRALSIADLGDVSNYDRVCMLEAGLIMVAERPFFGIGPNMVRERYAIYRHPTAPRTWVPHLHNAFLQIAAERGLMTLAALLLLFFVGTRLAWLELSRQGGLKGPNADILLAVVLGVIGFTIAGFFEDNWSDTEVKRVVLFLLAVPLSCFRTSSGSPPVGGLESVSVPESQVLESQVLENQAGELRGLADLHEGRVSDSFDPGPNRVPAG